MFARGMGLMVGVKERQSSFLIICRRSISLVIEITGPNFAYGCQRINTESGTSEPFESKGEGRQCHDGSNRIDINVTIRQSIVHVHYTPHQSGHYVINLISQGNHVLDSPYHVQVDEPFNQQYSSLPEPSTRTGCSVLKPSDHSNDTSVSHSVSSRRDALSNSTTSTTNLDSMVSGSSLANFRMCSLKQLQPVDCPTAGEGRVSRFVANFTNSCASLQSNNQRTATNSIDKTESPVFDRLDESMELEAMSLPTNGAEEEQPSLLERCSMVCTDQQDPSPPVQQLVVHAAAEQPENVADEDDDQYSSVQSYALKLSSLDSLAVSSIAPPPRLLEDDQKSLPLDPTGVLDELLDSTEVYNSSVERMFQTLYTQATSAESSKPKLVAQQSKKSVDSPRTSVSSNSSLSTRPALNGTVRSYLQSKQSTTGNVAAVAKKATSTSSLYSNAEPTLSRRRLLANSRKKRESSESQDLNGRSSPDKRIKPAATITATPHAAVVRQFSSPSKETSVECQISQFDIKSPQPNAHFENHSFLHKIAEQSESPLPGLNQSVQQKKNFWESLCSGDKTKSSKNSLKLYWLTFDWLT